MLPDALRAKTFANFVVTDGNREAFVAAKEAAIGTRGVFLTGGAGTGKTHLAAAVINEKAARGRSAFFCNVPRLLADMRAAAHEGGKVDAILRAVREADLLVLDDWGAEKITDWVNEQLYVIIDGRWMDGRQLVVTSNLAPEAIRRRMGDAGERVMSRLADMCRFVAVRGEDWRMKRRAQQVA
jgi:DNA replication protein DnaC